MQITINKSTKLPLPTEDKEKSLQKIDSKPPQNDRDQWLGVARYQSRQIPKTPFYLSRIGMAKEPVHENCRLNSNGYDKDDPKDAILKFEKAHPKTWGETIFNEVTDAFFNMCTFFVPKALSLSAMGNKQRIDQKIVLNITREAVDKFPELKLRISEDAFNTLHQKDQVRWHKNMAIIRAAQHDYIINELAQAYPGHIDINAPTILYTGGRATGLLRVLYCSVDEYVALYWSDWDLTSVDSGSYRSHVYDYIIEGQNINWNASDLKFKARDYEMTEPGEYTFLGEGDRKIWSFKGPCAMIDHGIGDIISMTKFALVSNFCSTLNMDQVLKLLSNEAKAVANEYAQRLKETLGFASISIQTSKQVNEQELLKAQSYFSQIINHAPSDYF